MSGFLRFIGTVNAAVWLGGGLFFSLFILPAVFSQDMHQVLGVAADSPLYTYYPGAIGMVLFKRFFVLQYICGTVALLHFFAEKLYLGRAFSKVGLGIVIGIFGLALLGGVLLQPRLAQLHKTMYSNAPQAQKDQAKKSFGMWHGLSQLANIVMLGGLVVHLVRVTRPDESSRYITFSKFWG